MAKGDTFLVPTILTATSPEELSKAVGAERLRRGQSHAKAYYSAAYIARHDALGNERGGYTKYFAFIEFSVEEV
jgi:hypothetical protein